MSWGDILVLAFLKTLIRLEMQKKIYRVVENQFLLSLSLLFIFFTFRFDILVLSVAISPLYFGARYILLINLIVFSNLIF